MRGAARTSLESLVVFALCAAAFYAMLAQRAAMFDYDALYHFKVARLILERGPWVDISWLPFTVLGDHGTDHHWLFHVLVAPLTLLGNDLRAVDIASAVVAALMPVALLPLLRRAAIPVAPLFAVAVMFAHSALPGRFLTLRAQDLAVVLMIAAMFAMAWRRTAWVGVVAFVFTQSYHGAVILGMILVTDAAARWIVERRFHLASVTAAAVGVLAGLLAQPWFPDNVRYLVFHTFFKTAQAYPGLVGTEWVPAPFYSIAMEGWPAHLLLLSGMVAAAIAARRAGPRILGIDTLSCLGVAAVTLAMYHFAWRFLEYYAPLAVTAAGLLWRDAARHLSWTRAKAGAVAAGLAALIAVGAYRGNERVAVSLTGPFDAYAAMMRYVDANDEHPMVFDAVWSDFQPMFFWSDRARFVSGLDGHYLLYGDPARFKVWNAIITGRTLERTDNARVILETFGARWIALPRSDEPIARTLERDPDARLVLEDRDGWLFHIEPAPAAR